MNVKVAIYMQIDYQYLDFQTCLLKYTTRGVYIESNTKKKREVIE